MQTISKQTEIVLRQLRKSQFLSFSLYFVLILIGAATIVFSNMSLNDGFGRGSVWTSDNKIDSLNKTILLLNAAVDSQSKNANEMADSIVILNERLSKVMSSAQVNHSSTPVQPTTSSSTSHYDYKIRYNSEGDAIIDITKDNEPLSQLSVNSRTKTSKIIKEY